MQSAQLNLFKIFKISLNSVENFSILYFLQALVKDLFVY